MFSARCPCLLTNLRLYRRMRRYEVSSIARVLNVSSVEQIPRKRQTERDGFSCVEDRINKVNADVCL